MVFIRPKGKVYLKTYLYSSHEIKFIKLNLKEAFDYIDKFIICEFNRTHVGDEKDFLFEKFSGTFTPAERSKILYIQGDLSNHVKRAKDSKSVHQNEQLMRGYFSNQISLHDQDVVFSVDADEIIFGHLYPNIINRLGFFRKAMVLQLYQFFYKINYLWENKVFIAPTVCFAGYYKNKYPSQWRYDGTLFPVIAGCHFSWCMSLDEMIVKLSSYSHHYDYSHLIDRNILEKAIIEKRYPFDSSVDFNISVLDTFRDKQYYPPSLFDELHNFDSLIAKK